MLQPVDYPKVLTTVNVQTLESISGKVLQRLLSTKQGMFTACIRYSTVFFPSTSVELISLSTCFVCYYFMALVLL